MTKARQFAYSAALIFSAACGGYYVGQTATAKKIRS